jgi:hypothetical protein
LARPVLSAAPSLASSLPVAPITQDDKQASTLLLRFADILCDAHRQPFQHLKEEKKNTMEIPENLDAFLTNLLQPSADEEPALHVELNNDERAFAERIMDSVTTGSKGIFVVLHPNDRMQYMLLNASRVGAIALLAAVMLRTAEALEADVE